MLDKLLNVLAPGWVGSIIGLAGIAAAVIAYVRSRQRAILAYRTRGMSLLGNDEANLPKEVSTNEAAQILGCDKKTVLKYIDQGLLEWRDMSPPSSTRPTYRLKLDSVLRLRNSYRVGGTNPDVRQTTRHKTRCMQRLRYQPKHITMKSDSQDDR